MSRPRGTVTMNGIMPKTLADYGIETEGRYVCPKHGCGQHFETLAEKKTHVKECDV